MKTTRAFGTTSWDEIVWLGLHHDLVQLTGTVRLAPSRVEFRFSNPDECRRLLHDFRILSSPQALQLHRTLDVIRNMRAAIRTAE